MRKINTKNIFFYLLLLASAFFWGSSFTATTLCLNENLPPAIIVFLRFFVASVLFLLISFKRLRHIKKREFIYSFFAGVFLFFAYYLQTQGTLLSTPSKSAFFISTNVIMLPFILWLGFKRRPTSKSFISLFVCFLGLIIISMNSSSEHFNLFNLNRGDLYSLISAFIFALHIAYLSIAVKKIDLYKLTFIQLITCTFFAFVFNLFTGKIDVILKSSFYANQNAIMPIIYLGSICTLLCFFFQSAAQSKVGPTRTAIIFSFEPVFAAIISVLSFLEKPTINMVLGGVLITFSAIISQMKGRKTMQKP